MPASNPIFGRHLGDSGVPDVPKVKSPQLSPSGSAPEIDVLIGDEGDASYISSSFQTSVGDQLKRVLVQIKVYRFSSTGKPTVSLIPESIRLRLQEVVAVGKSVPGYSTNPVLPGIVQLTPEILVLKTSSQTAVYLLQCPQGTVFFKDQVDRFILMPKG